MNVSRRRFLKTSGLLSIGIPLLSFDLVGKARKSDKFFSKIGVCTSISNSSILSKAGYSYLEEGVRSFLVPTETDEAFNEKLLLLKASGIPVESCNSFLPGDLKCVGPETHHEKILQFAETAFRRAKQAGIKTIVFGSGGSRNIPDGFSRDEAKNQFIEICKKMAPLASEHGLVISLEPLNSKECNFITSVKEGGQIVKAVGHPNFRLLADIYHMLMENEGPESIIENGKLLYHIHIAEKEGRSAPGVHGEDFTPYFRALKETGYKGRISIECRWENLEKQAEMALQTLNKQIESLKKT